MAGNKQLINSVSLNINEDNPHIAIDLAIPIKVEKADIQRLKGKDSIDLGVIEFSEETSDLVRKVGEAIREELLSNLK